MNKSSVKQTREARLVKLEFWMSYTGLGRNSAMKLGEDIGCKVKVGMKCYNKVVTEVANKI